MKPVPISGNSPQVLEMAKALGLDTVGLFRFIFDVQAGELVTVTAFYNKFVTVDTVTKTMVVTKRFNVVEIP